MSTGAASSSDPPPQPPLAASRLAPGFRFHPTDEELVSYYLKRKVCGRPLRVDAVAEVDLYKCEPWELPGLSRIRSRDLEWYFFSPLDRKYSNRSRTNRATPQGYWKTTGKDRPIYRGPRVVGMKKTLVFHSGRAPRGTRTNWVMHEYRLDDEELINAGISQDAYVVCRIFQKSGTGPQNGAQYGAPFLEEEWEEEEADGVVLMPDGGEDHSTEVTEQEYFEFSDFLQNEELNNQDENASNLVADLDGKDCGSVPDEATTLLDEILEDTSFTDMVESSDELGHPSNPAPIDQMELKPIIDCLHSQGQPNEKEDTSFTNIVNCVDGPGQLSSPSIDEMEIKPQLVDQTCGQSHPNGKDEYVELNDLANTVDMIYPSTEDSVNYPIRTCHAEKIQAVDENTNLQKMLDVEEFFDTMSQDADQPESLEMPADEANIYVQVNELNPFAGGCPSSPHLQGKMVISDAPSDDLTYGQENVELNGLLYSPVIDTSDFDMVDDLLAYFDATNENLQYDTIDFSRSSECMNSSDLSNFNEEVPDTSIPSGASSSSSTYNQSKDKYEGVTVTPDDQMKDTNNKTTRKHLMNMLGSIPASPAFAAEFPTTSGKSIAQISATQSASPIHVTAGFFHIYGSTMPGNAGQWPLQKDGHADLIFSCSITVDAVGKGADPEPGTKDQVVAVPMVLRGGLYLFFLSAFILAISYKVGLRFMPGKVVL